jgi:hypothetical protein
MSSENNPNKNSRTSLAVRIVALVVLIGIVLTMVVSGLVALLGAR